MWVLDHLADIESDFSVFHRIDDPLSLSGPEFFRKAYRLSAYRGVMYARVAAHQARSQPAATTGQAGSGEVKNVSLNRMQAMFPDLIEKR